MSGVISPFGPLKAGANLDDLTDPSVAYQNLGGGHSAKLQGWFAALAARNTDSASVVIMGDSLTAGEGATSFALTYAQQLAAGLNSRFPTVGLSTHGRGFLPPVIPPTNPTTFTPAYITITGATVEELQAAALFDFGPNLETWDISINTGVTLVYHLVGDSADIIWASNPGNGTFSYTVDAGSPTDVDTNAAFNVANVTTVSLGSAGAHDLTITFVSGASTFITGVIEYNGDSAAGVQVHDCGFSGSTSAFWVDASWTPALIPLGAGLLVIELGLNDNAANITPAVFAANLHSMITNIRTAYSDATVTAPPILLLAAYNAASDGPTTPAQWAKYVNEMYTVAAGDALIDVLDLTLRMPSTGAAVTWGLYVGDGIHPNDNGHQLMADILTDFLSVA